jgi:uncharacterized iron-regulated protein
MQDKLVSSKLRTLSPLALTVGLTLFGVGQMVGQGAQAHSVGHHTDAPQVTGIDPATRVLDLSALSDMDDLLGKIADRRVVFVGETHDRYEHHLNQLAIIEGLYRQDPKLTIGLEFFQQPFQRVMDDYIGGRIDERKFLNETEYFERWRYDYRLYRPILRFARAKGIPVVALNVPGELTSKVSKVGIDALAPEDRKFLPRELDRSDEAYRERIMAVFASHPGTEERDFEHFLEAQLLWDEGMAERAARYLKEHPDRRLVILAGSGHLVYGQGIPNRLQRRMPVTAAVVINDAEHALKPGIADYLLFPQPVELPRAGLLGVLLDLEGDGVSVKGFSDSSPAQSAGLKEGDRILSIGGSPVDSYTDIRVALMDRKAGESVPVEIVRENLFLGDERMRFDVELY